MAELKKLKNTPENKKFWEQVEKCAKEVESWPEWKREEADKWWDSFHPVELEPHFKKININKLIKDL